MLTLFVKLEILLSLPKSMTNKFLIDNFEHFADSSTINPFRSDRRLP